MTTTQPAFPIVPVFHREAMANFRRTLRARDFDTLADTIFAVNGYGWTSEQQAEVDAYNRQVRTYNAWLDAQRKARKARIEAAQVVAERKAVQAATCTTCFCVHAGECY